MKNYPFNKFKIVSYSWINMLRILVIFLRSN